MIFFFIALSICILAGTFFMATSSTNSLEDGALAALFAFFLLAVAWLVGLVIFVVSHFISKYW